MPTALSPGPCAPRAAPPRPPAASPVRRAPLVLLLAGLFALSACGSEPEPEPPPVPGEVAPSGEVVLTVNGIPVHKNMFDAVVMRVPPRQRDRLFGQPGQLDSFTDQIALGTMMYDKAIAAGLHDDPAIQEGISMAAREFLAGMYVQRQGDAAVTDAAVRAWYDEHKIQYERPQVKARHILVAEESKANELVEQLKGGADFVALARDNSTDASNAADGGDLGWFEKERMAAEFSQAAFAAEVGEVVGPVSTRFGFHVIRVDDKRDEVPIEDARPAIEAAVRQQAIDDTIVKAREGLVVDKNRALIDTIGTPAGAQPAGARSSPVIGFGGR